MSETKDIVSIGVADQVVRQIEEIQQLQFQLAAEQEKRRWRPVEELPPRSKSYHHSKWYILTDGTDWTIGYYDFPFATWSTGHSPFDLSMDAVTHWRPIYLPEEDIESLQSQLAAEQKENKRLCEFARYAIRQCWSAIDGCDIQEMAEKLDLIVPKVVTEKDVDYEIDYEVGDTIFEFSDILKEKP